MQPKTWLVILFSIGFLLALISCAQVPDKPDVNLCTLDLPRRQLICASTTAAKEIEDVEKARRFIRTQSSVYTIPIEQADKYVAFSPDDWAKISSYAKQLREIVQRQCK